MKGHSLMAERASSGEMLAALGELLFGKQWQRPLARAVRRDERQIRRRGGHAGATPGQPTLPVVCRRMRQSTGLRWTCRAAAVVRSLEPHFSRVRRCEGAI